MNFFHEKSRDIPVYGNYDVLVAGGGCAGFAAALSAARNGANVLVVEQYPFFGGTATAGLMINMVGFRNQVEPDEIQVAKGIAQELILRLINENAAKHSENSYPCAYRSDTKNDLSYNYVIDAERLKFDMMSMLIDEHVNILFHTFVSDTIMEENIVKGVIIENKSGRQAVFAEVVIDCTGDGDVAFRAGVPFYQAQKGEKRLMDCLMYRISYFGSSPDIYSVVDGNSAVLWGPVATEKNCANGQELTESEIYVRSQVYADLDKKILEDPKLLGSKIVETPVSIGIRQTRFIQGEYMLSGNDVLEGHHFSDSIAVGINPVISFYGYRRFLKHNGYHIPYRCLVPVGVDGLLIAGRCISADQIAFESYRAMAHILCIGEAAGTAAALAIHKKCSVKKVDIKLLQTILMKQGAEIGVNL